MNKIKTIGLTGGYGSGKSTVAKMFAAGGCLVIDADELARQAVEPGKPALKKIAARFGRSVLKEDSSLDRMRLAAVVFGNREDLSYLNSVVHPVVIKEIKKRVAAAAKRRAKAVVISAPLLIEAGVNGMCDEVIVIKVKKEVQLERCRKSKAGTTADIKRRIAAQMPLSRKLKYADRVIDNNGPLSKTEKQVKEILKNITK